MRVGMEWNGARVKFPQLDAATKPDGASPESTPATGLSLLATTDFPQLCRVGFALTWPVLVGAIGVIVALLMRG